MAMNKFSRQRKSIHEYLMTTKEHPTADIIYTKVREVYPNISLGTVYRNLNLLSDQGKILKLSYGNGSDRFDGNSTPHYHFLCTKCQSVLDLEMDYIENMNTIANLNFGGQILGHTTLFYGICPHCKE